MAFLQTIFLALLVAGIATANAAPPNPLPPNSTSNAVTIPFEFKRGHVMVPAKVSGQPLSLMLDTGYALTMIRPDVAEKLQLKHAGHITILGIAGNEQAGLFEGVTFDISGALYSPRSVASLPSERRAWDRDGILGAGLFRQFVVEIDSKAKLVRLHQPKNFQHTGPGEVIPLDYRDSIPVIAASILVPGRPAISARFEVDTGCDGLCLGAGFVQTNKLAEFAGKTTETFRRGVGGGAHIIEGRLPQIRLGHLTIDQPAANFFQHGSPVDGDLAGHIGMGLLREFKVIFDYSRDRMILE